jgi:hypothetical protein
VYCSITAFANDELSALVVGDDNPENRL